MIDYRAMDAIHPLMERIVDSDVAVVAKPQSLLSQLVATSAYEMSIDETTKHPIMPHEEYRNIFNGRSVEDARIDTHGGLLEELMPLIIKGARRDLEIANGVVVPTVADIVDRVNSHMTALTPHQLLGFEVIAHTPAKPLVTGSLTTLIEQYSNALFAEVVLKLRLPELPTSEIHELCSTGAASLDNDIKEWLAVKGDDWVMMAWEDLFQLTDAPVGGHARSWEELRGDRKDGTDYMLFAFLIARRLIDNPLDVPGATLKEWNRYFGYMRDMAAKQLVIADRQIQDWFKAKIVVLEATGNKVVVFEPVYKEWIESGSPEVLFGALISNYRGRTAEALAGEAPRLLKVWEAREATLRLSESNRMHGEFIQAMRQAFQGYLYSLPEDEKARLGNLNLLVQAWNKHAVLLKRHDAECIYQTVTRLVCDVMFKATNAHRLLMLHHDISTHNPKLSPNEAASLALMQHIIDWMMEQVSVER